MVHVYSREELLVAIRDCQNAIQWIKAEIEEKEDEMRYYTSADCDSVPYSNLDAIVDRLNYELMNKEDDLEMYQENLEKMS